MHKPYYITTHEPGVSFLFMTGLERNRAGGLLTCWHCDESEALRFPTREAAEQYLMPMVREKHPTIKDTVICRMTPDENLGDMLNDAINYTRAMKVVG